MMVTFRLLPLCLIIAADGPPASSLPADGPAVPPVSHPHPAEGSSPPGSPPAGAGRYAGYAGSTRCAACHPKSYADWQSSHHAQALRPIIEAIDRPAMTAARIPRSPDPVFRTEWSDHGPVLTLTGPDGRPGRYEPVAAIGYRPLWQYLIPMPGGRWQVTEAAYDPAFGEWFNVFGEENRKPGEWGHWTGRGMNFNAMCADCHTTAYQRNYDPLTDTYASTWLEMGVGCEQCHGPMGDHCDWQAAHPGQANDPTLRRYQPAEYQQVCAVCHARRIELAAGFRPGDSFDQHYELVLPDTSDVFYPDGQVRDETFEYAAFVLSSMARAGVRCLDCHDPHTAKIPYRKNLACQRCHEHGIAGRIPIDPVRHGRHPSGSPGSACVDCHMPRTTYMQRHPRHDHGMTIPDPLLTRQFGIPNACNRCHTDQTADWALNHVDRWYGPRMDRPSRRRAILLARLKEGDVTALTAALDWLAGEPHPCWRAVGAKMVGACLPRLKSPDMRQRTIAVLIRQLGDPSPPAQAAAIEALTAGNAADRSSLAPLLSHSTRLVRIRTAWALREHLEAEHPAMTELESYLRLHLDQPAGAFQQANYLMSRGRIAEAIGWYEKAVAWDPGSAASRYNFALALHAAGRTEEAEHQLRTAADIDPADAASLFALGLLYSEMNRPADAVQALRGATARAPRESRYWYNLGLAEARLDRLHAALEALRRAEQLDPREPDYPFARATIHQRLGQQHEFQQAIRRTLSIDPDYPPARGLSR